MEGKVLIIGLDGASPSLVDHWVEAGCLPNLGEAMRRGVYGRLKSTIPPLSCPAWTSSVTGVNPGKHNLFDFTVFRGYEREITTSAHRKARPIWDILSAHGLRVGIMNVPTTFPPEEVNGFMVSGLGTPSLGSEFVYPRFLRERLKREGYKVDLNYGLWLSTLMSAEKGMEALIEDAWDMAEKRKEAALKLMNEFDPQFFMVVFVLLDRIQHFFWKYMDHRRSGYDPKKVEKIGNVVQRAYEKIDSIVGEILAKTHENTNVIVFSDHGFGPNYKSAAFNTWFKNIGLIKLRKSLRGHLRNIGVTQENILRIACRGIRMIESEALWRLIVNPSTSLRRIIPRSRFGVEEDCDWNQTKAWYLSCFGIKINMVGREPQGVVSPGKEYEDLRDYIKAELLKLKDPENGERLVKSVHRREDIYSGPCVRNAPDLIIEMQEGYTAYTTIGNELVTPTESNVPPFPSGGHRPEGMLLLKGPSIKEGLEIRGGEITDITPTVLYLLGLPPPTYMDGRVLTDAIEPAFLRDHPATYEDTGMEESVPEEVYTEEETEELKGQLRALGYL